MTEKRFNVWEQEPIQKTTKTTITQNKRFSIWDCNAMENLLNTFVHDSEKNGQDNTLLTHKECCDLLNELNEECGRLNIICNAKERTIKNLLEMGTNLEKENEQLKSALREQLEENGNSYYINLFDKIFNLKYHEWYNSTTPNNEPYVDWEKIAREKELNK